MNVQQTGGVFNYGGKNYVLQTGLISLASGETFTITPASDKFVVVVGYVIGVVAGGLATWIKGASTPISGALGGHVAGQNYAAQPCAQAWLWTTTAGQLLKLTATTAGVTGHVLYVEVDALAA